MQMRRGWNALILTVVLVLAAIPATARPTGLDAQVLAEINAARVHPAAYAKGLRAYRRYYDGRVLHDPGAGPGGILTFEGVSALDEAVAFLERQAPLPPLAESSVLMASAAEHAADTGPRGIIGHVGADGSTLVQRILRHGTWGGIVAENIAYGPDTAIGVVRQLIVDDGVRSRGHRANIFEPQLRYAGVGCGPHRVYQETCVVDFASTVAAR